MKTQSSPGPAARVWAVVTSVAPLRVWMFDGGAVVFSASKAAPSDVEKKDPAQLKSLGFNLWTQDRASTIVWRCAHASVSVPPLMPLADHRLAPSKQSRESSSAFGTIVYTSTEQSWHLAVSLHHDRHG